MTERFSEKDLERAAKELIGKDNDPNVLRRHFCNVCAKAYRRIGNCKKHILNEHLNDVVKRAEDIERELDKKMKEWEEKSAMKSGSQYFEEVEYSLEHLLQEVRRCKKGFEKARDQEPYENGYMPPRTNMVDEIRACMHHVTNNFTHDVSRGTIAVGQLVKAFGFDI